MITKLTSINDGIKMLEAIDQELLKMLAEADIDDEGYEFIDKKLNERKIIISEINKLKDTEPILDESVEKIRNICEKTGELLGVVAQKKGKISERLGARKKNLARNRHFAY